MSKVFEITAPDGHVLEVTGPAGATAEQALAQAQKLYQPKEMPTQSAAPVKSAEAYDAELSPVQAGVLEAGRMSQQVLNGIPQAVTALPSTIRSGADALMDMVSGKGTGKAQTMIENALTPVTASARGAGALAAPHSVAAPSQQEFEQAAQGAGANAGGLILGELGGRLLSRASAPPSVTAPELMRGALRRGVPIATDIAETRALANTALQYEIPVSEAGLQKIGGLIKDMNDAVSKDVAAGAAKGMTVDKFKVASRLSDEAAKARLQANPAKDIQAISNSGNEFLREHPADIPVDTALKIKQGTYRAVGDRAYGEESTAAKGAQKALARGIREELANLFPESAKTLKEQGPLIELQDAIEKAVNKELNGASGPGLKTGVTATAAGILTGSGFAGLGVGMLKAVLDDPGVRSQLAITLAKNAPGSGAAAQIQALMKIGRVSGSLGARQQATEATDR